MVESLECILFIEIGARAGVEVGAGDKNLEPRSRSRTDRNPVHGLFQERYRYVVSKIMFLHTLKYTCQETPFAKFNKFGPLFCVYAVSTFLMTMPRVEDHFSVISDMNN